MIETAKENPSGSRTACIQEKWKKPKYDIETAKENPSAHELHASKKNGRTCFL